jgi:hypothetical protein
MIDTKGERPPWYACLIPSPVFIREATVLAMLMASAYSCVVGAFFAVFVPQRCPIEQFYKEGNVTKSFMVNDRECSFEENVYINIDPYNVATLLVNLTSAILLLVGFAFEFQRSAWIIEHLDVDYDKPENHLADDLVGYESFRQTLFKLNKTYYNLFLAIGIVNTVNVGMSIYLIYLWYANFRSITTFLTSFLLVFNRIYYSVSVAAHCRDSLKAQSVSLVEPLSFNAVAKQYRGFDQRSPSTRGAGAHGAGAHGAGSAADLPGILNYSAYTSAQQKILALQSGSRSGGPKRFAPTRTVGAEV